MLKKMVPPAIIIVGAALLLLGLARGEALEVFQKAARICFECMGLGR